MVVTRGKSGAVAIQNNEVEQCNAIKNLKIRDLTGAILFAAGFLHGYINKLSSKIVRKKELNYLLKIIQQVGARL